MERTLHLTLKKKWFDMIASGEKKEEYREIKPYWIKRLGGILIGGSYVIDVVGFGNVSARNGYQKDAPTIIWEHGGIRIGKPNPVWCEPEDVGTDVFILDIGEVSKV